MSVEIRPIPSPFSKERRTCVEMRAKPSLQFRSRPAHTIRSLLPIIWGRRQII